MKLLRALLNLFVFFAATVVAAAELEPFLAEQLLAAKAGERFSVIVKLYSPRDIRALDAALHARRAKLAERHIAVIDALKANARETQGPVLFRLEEWKSSGLVEGYTAYWIDNLIVVYGAAEAILQLAEDPAVESIGPNFKAELIEPVTRGPVRGTRPGALDTELTTPGQNAIGATRVNRELGYTGRGTIVAGVDTGVDGLHPALQSRWRGNFAPVAHCWLDLIGTGSDRPRDNHGHGTHTMGTMCGREIRSNRDTITVGSAPDARWIATNPINQGVGDPFNQDILDAFQWLADPDGNPQTLDDVPDVIQNSWGVYTGLGYPRCYANWNQAILNCEAAGPVVTWSAGNEGSAGLRSPAIFQLTPTQIFSVGAVDASNYPNAPYPIAGFSSRGPSGCAPAPSAVKPEISAPGVNVYSCYTGGSYTNMDGTSMAGPHVAGIVALMREACPDCDPQTIKEILMATAIDSGYGPAGEDNTFGAGFLNGYAAVLAVANRGRIDGFVTRTGGVPVSGVRVQVLQTDAEVLTNAQGYYNISAQEGLYTLRFSRFGLRTVLRDSIRTMEGETTRVNVQMDSAEVRVLCGTVVQQGGHALPGARVTVTGTPLDTLVTDAQGRFAVRLPATNYVLHLRYIIRRPTPVIVDADTAVAMTGGDTTFVVLRMFLGHDSPSARDDYGYRAYDRYDRDLPAPYEWVELDPALGRPGVPFSFIHHDSSVFLRAPFPLKFYGLEWDTLTVNNNGWLLPGVDHHAAPTNTGIPYLSPNDPLGIIAPFWDDLRLTTGSRQFQWHDSARGRWILEFVDQRLVSPGNMVNNWEVHFLDPAFHPTVTGDCEIVFVYGAMGYTGGCTVGIEEPSQLVGIQVLHNGNLSATSWPVEEGSAIRFTTGRGRPVGRLRGNLVLYPSSPNITSAVIRAGGRTISPNSSGQFADDSVAVGQIAVLLQLPGYEQYRVSEIAVDSTSVRTIAIEAWRLDPPRELSATQEDRVVTLRWRKPQSVVVHDNPDVRYSVYRDGELMALDVSDTAFTDEPLPDSMIVRYTVKAHYRFGVSAMSDTLTVQIGLAARESAVSLPASYALYPNYPNPFNAETRLRFDLPQRAEVRLEIYDVTGRLVRVLWEGSLAGGRYEFTWDGRDRWGREVATGLYFCRFAAARFEATRKMLLLR